MGKGFYIHSVSKTDFPGVYKKIDNQISAFKEYCDVESIEIKTSCISFLKLFIWALPGGSYGYKYRDVLEKIDASLKNGEVPDFFYIRKQIVDFKYLLFIRRLKHRYSSSKIVMEVPTFPYYGEMISAIGNYPYIIKDKFYTSFLHYYVDRIATYSLDDAIFNIPTIKVMNGIKVDGITTAKTSTGSGPINMLAVALLQPHHGYERVIEGLANYYNSGGTRDIIFHIVGDGIELDRYKSMAEQYNIADRIIFYGRLTGNALDDVYDGKDIAITSLGMYKLGINYASVLKSREYLAKGLPMMTGCKIDTFVNNPFEFYMEVPNDGSCIDIYEVIDFVDNIRKKDLNCISQSIRKYAEDYVDIKKTMKPIIEFMMK